MGEQTQQVLEANEKTAHPLKKTPQTPKLTLTSKEGTVSGKEASPLRMRIGLNAPPGAMLASGIHSARGHACGAVPTYCWARTSAADKAW